MQRYMDLHPLVMKKEEWKRAADERILAYLVIG